MSCPKGYTKSISGKCVKANSSSNENFNRYFQEIQMESLAEQIAKSTSEIHSATLSKKLDSIQKDYNDKYPPKKMLVNLFDDPRFKLKPKKN